MATANTAPTATATTGNATKRTAPAPTKGKATAPKAAGAAATAAGSTATPRKATGSKAAQAAVAQMPKFKFGPWPITRAGTIRFYARGVAQALSKKHRAGFTLAQYRVALIAGQKASSCPLPNGGWAKHNMPTWASHAKQGWLVAAKGK